MTIKIFHTGDLHIGMTYGNRPYSSELKQKLMDSRLNVLKKTVEIANERSCQLFLVAGDLFHRTTVKKEYIVQAAKILSDFAGNSVVVLPGNHDHLEGYDSIWEAFNSHVEDHVVVLDNWEPVVMDDYGLDITLYPAPCEQKHSGDHGLHWIKELQEKPETTWHLGIAHGAVEGVSPDFQGQYYPMSVRDLEQTGIDHWLLGHTHIPYPRSHVSGKNQIFTYCGTPEPDGFDCDHGGYARIVHLDLKSGGLEQDNKEIYSELLTTGEYRFMEIYQEIEGISELKLVEKNIANQVDRMENTLVKLKLSGILEKDEFQKLSDELDKLRERLAYLEVDTKNVSIAIDAEIIKEEYPENSLSSLLLNRLWERGEQDALQMAYQMIRKVNQD